ncbi:hypothetical protein BS78_03G392000 [Paspalum vaginatum]|nr:hypothetical protein BS78_03G392000 [Paspalum vaginatum]
MHHHAWSLRGKPDSEEAIARQLLEVGSVVSYPNNITTGTSNNASAVDSTALGEGKIKVIFCVERLCYHTQTCYCCMTSKPPLCYDTKEECWPNCPACNPKCPPSL